MPSCLYRASTNRLAESDSFTVMASVFFSSMAQPKKDRHRQGWRAGSQKPPKRRRETLVETVGMSGRLLWPDTGADLFCDWRRHGVGRVRVEIGADLVRCHAVAEKVCNGQHNVGRWHFDLDLVQPAPDMHLTNLRPRHAITNAARQIDLATGQLDGF